jgi:hypothetical protein
MKHAPMKRLAILCALAVPCAGLIASLDWWAIPTDSTAGATRGLDFSASGAGSHAGTGPAVPPLGSLPAAAVVDARYRLEGVESGTAAEGAGIARIAVDGAAARDFRVAQSVASGLVLLGVSPGGAILGPPGGPPMVVLGAVAGTAAAGPTQNAGQRLSSAAAAGLRPVPGPAGLLPSLGSAPVGVAPTSSVAVDRVLVPAADLAPDILAAALPQSSRPSSGRRDRLQHPKPGP